MSHNQQALPIYIPLHPLLIRSLRLRFALGVALGVASGTADSVLYYTETVNPRFLIRPFHVRLVQNNGAPLKSALVERFPFVYYKVFFIFFHISLAFNMCSTLVFVEVKLSGN